jgi:hypothetical protein
MTIMQRDAHNMDREERHALLEQRRSAVAHQLRRLATELTDIDRQLDEIQQSEGQGTPSDMTEGVGMRGGRVTISSRPRPRHRQACPAPR